MALIHEKLYQIKNFDSIDLNNYISSLVDMILDGFDRNKIKLELDIENIYIAFKEIVPIALIINELLTNSIKYVFNQSICNIYISIKKDQNDSISQIIYKDNGKGFDYEDCLNKSKGLGLKLIDQLSDQINLSLNVISNKKDKNTFIFTKGAKKKKLEKNFINKNNKKIFIVEDEIILVMVLKIFLENNNYSVVGITKDSKTTIDLLESLKDKPDVILMDINLNGESGLELSKIITDKYNIPIVFRTGYELEEINRQANKFGLKNYIVTSKNILESELLNKINSMIN